MSCCHIDGSLCTTPPVQSPDLARPLIAVKMGWLDAYSEKPDKRQHKTTIWREYNKAFNATGSLTV